MAIAKVVLNGTTQMDTTQVTVTANTLAQGVTALGADGALVTGTMSGGGYTLEQFLSGEVITGAITYLGTSIRACSFGKTDITEFHAPNLTVIDMPVYNGQSTNSNLFYGCSKLTTIDCPELIMQRDNFAPNNSALTTVNLPKNTYIGTSSFAYCTSLKNIVFPLVTTFYTNCFQGCTKLEGADFGASVSSGSINGIFRSTAFTGCTNFNKLVLRTSHDIYPLGNINNFTNTPFASGNAGGTLYVPQALIASYQAATNWSTILGYTNNRILSIEGSIYETQYVDGSPIPTA